MFQVKSPTYNICSHLQSQHRCTETIVQHYYQCAYGIYKTQISTLSISVVSQNVDVYILKVEKTQATSHPKPLGKAYPAALGSELSLFAQPQEQSVNSGVDCTFSQEVL